MAHITVIGSVNLDLVATAPRLPRPGETITDATFSRHPGGKGANQALAARRMGADVRFVGRTGADPEAALATALLRDAGVDLAACREDPTVNTGVALIVVDANGENQIVVAPGANRRLDPDGVAVAASDTVVCQLEIPVETVAHAVARAAFSILNAAPARELPPQLLSACDVVVVNETEAEFYGERLDDVALVVTTLGAEGAVATRGGRQVARVPAPQVETVDTVGAGDTFVGALAVELADGADLTDALRLACAAGALATTVSGAQSSIPDRSAVLDLMART
ncbi:MAG: ribokinase [Acidimicrobiia bacterium]|nr:ribokinase [Acidimicrobiia bacterium]